jgi:hypothetical protein
VELKTFGGYETKYFDLCKDNKPCLVFLVRPNDWQATTFEWWSPLHQCVSVPNSTEAKVAQARCRGVVSQNANTLLKVVASKAFGMLQKTALVRIAGALGIDLGRAKDLLDILVCMIGEVLGENDEYTVLQLIKHRVVPKDDSEFFQDMLESDDVLDIMDPDDKEDARRDIAKGREQETERQSFKAAWKERKSTAKAASKKKGKADAAKAFAKTWKGLKQFPENVPEQAQMKCMTPRGGYIWRANDQRAWCGHYKPWPRCSASWLEHGPRESARIVIEQLWRFYLDDNDLPLSACPVKGVFTPPAGAASSSADAA